MSECTDCDSIGCPSCSPDECAAEALAEAWDVAADDAEQRAVDEYRDGERSLR